MNVVAIIQARMSSNRLPAKVMKVTQGKTVLRHVIERTKGCKKINHIVVATTINDEDEVIVNEAKSAGVTVYRGSLENVLDRYYHAAKAANADIIVRITSDCPLIDSSVICDLVDMFLCKQDENIDYIRGIGFPIGINAEVFSFAALERSWREATIEYEFEHVTPYIYNHPELFKVDYLNNAQDLSHLRITLDTVEDWELIRTIFEKIHTEDEQYIRLADILELFASEPELISINQHIKQKTLGE